MRGETLDIELEPFVLGGQRYEASPGTMPVELDIAQASGAMVFDMRLAVHLSGVCMRCLGFAELDSTVSAREFHDLDAPVADELHSDYVVRDHLQLTTWARDAVALELPDQILCQPDCAGLCPACGTNRNRGTCECDARWEDPRLAALKALKATTTKRES